MNKKQKNRKIVTQNNRNRMINRRYISTIKTLAKLLIKNMKEIKLQENIEKKKDTLILTSKILNKFFSFLDKAVKKRILHKNTVARKKSKIRKNFDPLKKQTKFIINSSDF